MSDDIAIPEAGEALVDRRDDRWIAAASWYRVFARLAAAFNDTMRTLGDTATGLATKADKDQTVCASFTFKFPENETVALILNAPFGWTITEATTITEVGTSTVTVKINTTALGGTANSASTTQQSQAHSSANMVVAGDKIQVTFSSTSSDCENLCLTLKGTRVLA